MTTRHARRGRRVIIVFTLAAFALLVVPSVAGAWANGSDYGNGFGTHDWVLYEANRLAGSRGYHWLAWSAAQRVTDDPDTKIGDTWYHSYDVWGSTYGDAPSRVAGLYSAAVDALRADDRAKASRKFGLLSHYFSDVCNPTHTDGSDTEDEMHAAYESAVDNRTDEKGEHRSWVSFNGIQVRNSAKSATISAAKWSHQYYSPLVKSYNANGYSTAVNTITRRCLNRAANDLADLIVSVRKAARYRMTTHTQKATD
jgi:hypothetical protein